MSEVRIHAHDGGSFAAYLATPHATRATAGIILIQEIFGVNAVMRGLCDQLAAEGYFVLCPDLFWRQEPGVDITDQTEAEWQKAFSLYRGFNEAKGVEDLIATLEHLRRMPGTTGKVGTIGYCLGGKLAYLIATRSDVDCAVGYYGVGIETALGEASAITRPLLLHIAEKDQFVPPAAQAKITDAMSHVPTASTHIYVGADHAFCRVGGKHHDAAACALATERTRVFLRHALG